MVRFAAGILLRREERSEFFAQRPAESVFVTAGDGIGKERQSHRAEAGKAGEGLAFVWSGGALLLLDALKGAARRMSRAFAFCRWREGGKKRRGGVIAVSCVVGSPCPAGREPSSPARRGVVNRSPVGEAEKVRAD